MVSNMYELFVSNPILAVIFLVIAAAVIIFMAVKLIQKIGLGKIKAVVYQGFLEAEHEFLHGENTQKFDYVVQLARSALPAPLRMFLTEAVLKKAIQAWFDLCKDLLDDGKLNGTGIDK